MAHESRGARETGAQDGARDGEPVFVRGRGRSESMDKSLYRSIANGAKGLLPIMVQPWYTGCATDNHDIKMAIKAKPNVPVRAI